MRHTRSHTRNRRSHHALKASDIVFCTKCENPKEKHKVCLSCGTYKGKEVINTLKKAQKKLVKQKRAEVKK